ncbi:diacylglycerol kinase (ATP) [Kineococcus xinjiangensis]|uniref:Diacylglycerol kinase (ATP) n=1 Tax=Kineococcus xinjiangensis TaxID=512762 RepID=A0A2S6IKJ8_9ACTN|nr:diacylglycerol kinase family protein [Kineococcus xinjiangensis]PPK94705.1 diacylglycerol kinase (ATP) [Kineococcus xinjiangensis]
MSPAGRVGLLVNPTAGRGDGAEAGARTLAALRRLGHRVVDLTGPDLDTSTQHAHAAAGDLDALVVVGGDGLVHAGVQVTAGTGVPLGIVPAGTGNDIARGLDLPLGDPPAAVQVLAAALADGRHRDLDAVRVDSAERSGWYASILSSGVDALANERANAWRWPKGPSRYTLATVRELAAVRPVHLDLSLDGDSRRVEALLVAVANTPSYGGGVRVAPGADPQDGLLDVVVVDAMSTAAAFRLMPAVLGGRHVGHPAVTVHRARTVRLSVAEDTGTRRSRRPRPHADGEPAGSLPLTCTAVPGALRILR